MVTGARPRATQPRDAGPADNAGVGLVNLWGIAQATGGVFSLRSASAEIRAAAGHMDFDVTRDLPPWQGTVVTVTLVAGRAERAIWETSRLLADMVHADPKADILSWGDGPDGAARVEVPAGPSGFVEDKDFARKARDEIILPALAAGSTVAIDLGAARLVTHSFVHALLYEPIRSLGRSGARRIHVRVRAREARAILRAVAAYAVSDAAP